jgi:hypothetical protein
MNDEQWEHVEKFRDLVDALKNWMVVLESK